MGSEITETLTIGELLARDGGSVKTGPFGTTLKASEYSSEGVPLISVREVGYGNFHVDQKTPRVTKATTSRLSEYLLRDGDIVFARKGSVDRCALVTRQQEGWFLGSDGIRLRPPASVNPRFLLYWFLSPISKDWLNQQATGSTMASLNQAILGRVPLLLPPLEGQTRIAETLGSLDDKIALLRETNATLEAIALALFKSWFVDFDPVRAKAEGRDPEGVPPEVANLFPSEFEDSELGVIPKEWRAQRLDQACEINPTRRLCMGAESPYLEMSAVPTKGHRPESPVLRLFSSGTKFINGDTLLARITPCLENGKSAFVDFLTVGDVGWGSTEFIVLRPRNPLPDYWGYLLCRHEPFRQFAIQAMVGTSGRQRVEVSRLAQYPVAVPTTGIAAAFGNLVEPLRVKIASNDDEMKIMAGLRDTLLPRLMSGKLRLGEATCMEEIR